MKKLLHTIFGCSWEIVGWSIMIKLKAGAQ